MDIKKTRKFASEIKRLLKSGGVYISLAEQDSGAAIEYPEALETKRSCFLLILLKKMVVTHLWEEKSKLCLMIQTSTLIMGFFH